MCFINSETCKYEMVLSVFLLIPINENKILPGLALIKIYVGVRFYLLFRPDEVFALRNSMGIQKVDLCLVNMLVS